MYHFCMEAAGILEEGIDIEVDLRTLLPLDMETILKSVRSPAGLS